MSQKGLQGVDHNHLKYAVAVTRVGGEVLLTVFKWGFAGSTSIKDALLQLPGYSSGRFRKDFNASQRQKIESNEPVEQYDITLLYRLLQLICGLAGPNDSKWIDTTSKCLENRIHLIKNERNDLAHERLHLTEKDMWKRLTHLKTVLHETITLAGERFGLDEDLVKRMDDGFQAHLDAIRDSPLPPANMEAYRQTVANLRANFVTEEGRRELFSLYSMYFEVDLAPWLLLGTSYYIRRLFSEPELRQEDNPLRQDLLRERENKVEFSNVLNTVRDDGSVPDTFVFSGNPGMGKTTLAKALLEEWVTSGGKSVGGLTNIKLILLVEASNTSASTFDELLVELMPRTSRLYSTKEFRQIVCSLDVLIIIDGMDESTAKSKQLVENILHLSSPNIRTVITTRPENALSLQLTATVAHKKFIGITVLGVPDRSLQDFIQCALQLLVPEEDQQQNDAQAIVDYLAARGKHVKELLKSPQVINLIVLLWVFVRDRVNAFTTITDLYLQIEELLVHKLLQKLAGSGTDGIHGRQILRTNIDSFLLKVSEVALEGLQSDRLNLEDITIDSMTQECQAMQLPSEVMLSTFFSYSKTRKGLEISERVAYPHKTNQEYHAAKQICRMVDENPENSIRDILLSFDNGNSENSAEHLTKYLNVVKYVVGILAVQTPDRLEERSREIVSILKEAGVSKTCQWLEYIEEGKESPKLVRRILKTIGPIWELEDYAISPSLLNMLKMAQPHRLKLVVTKDPSGMICLEDVLKDVSTKDMSIELLLYNHFWYEGKEVSDEYLKILTSSSKTTLENFAGHLSKDAIQLLPKTLSRVALRITPDDIKELNSKLSEMSNLQMLYVRLDVSHGTVPSDISRIKPPMGVILAVDIWDFRDGDVAWLCDVAKSFSGRYQRLVLRRSNMSFTVCNNWLEGLYNRRVLASWIVVGSSEYVSKEEEADLKRKSAKIGCTKFVWIKT
ncbi:uncharacterized protein LOC143035067 [Oratosquilla oratoria]|uniref:uncharacterized protein LOC143035067 n=1 Tax=Oratosquilla oratoria TaxID=337810 RepID=UPI003F75847D